MCLPSCGKLPSHIAAKHSSQPPPPRQPTSAESNMRYPAAAAYSTAWAVPTPSPAVPKPTVGITQPLDTCTSLKGLGVCRALHCLQAALQAINM